MFARGLRPRDYRRPEALAALPLLAGGSILSLVLSEKAVLRLRELGNALEQNAADVSFPTSPKTPRETWLARVGAGAATGFTSALAGTLILDATERFLTFNSEDDMYAAPLKYYTRPADEPLLFHVMDVGEGLMILIVFPDETTMLYDCNVTNDNTERVLDDLGRFIPTRPDPENDDRPGQWIDVFVNSHRDQDHYRGLKSINGRFQIRAIWDSGQSGDTCSDDNYLYYMDLRRRLKEKRGDDALTVPEPSRDPVAEYGGAKVFCLSSSETLEIDGTAGARTRDPHTYAIVLSIQYAQRSLLLTSDSDWLVWRERIVPDFSDSGLLRSSILVASHHGSKSFFMEEANNEGIDEKARPATTYLGALPYIKPVVTLISCGSGGSHPNADALKQYEQYTSAESSGPQVYTTGDKGGLIGFVSADGRWTVCPSRFHPKNNNHLDLQCRRADGTAPKPTGDGSMTFQTGTDVDFTAIPKGGLGDPPGSLVFDWEVSNSGVGQDEKAQDIYSACEADKKDPRKFARNVHWEGTHLLRCSVSNTKNGQSATRIFTVHGVK